MNNPVTTGWERVAELWVKCNGRWAELAGYELQEINHIMKLNVEYQRNLATLKNLSYMAHITDDTEEQHKICAAVEELEATGECEYLKNLRRQR